MEERNVYTGKTVQEAVDAALQELGITAEQADITVLEEGKKKLFGSIKAKVKVTKKLSDGARAVEFIDGLMSILGVNAVSEIVSEDEKIEISVTSTDSNKVIGRHGEILDAIQCLAGAVANIGREDYKKVVVDCENYRAGREKTLTELAERLAKKAIERQRRVTLEPMNPYERRIIHSALIENPDVKTVSSGKEPARFVVIIPNNEKPYDGRKEKGGKERRFDFRGAKGEKGDRRDRRRGDRRERGERSEAPRPSRPRGKKEIHFGTFLGNSGAAAKAAEPETTQANEGSEEQE